MKQNIRLRLLSYGVIAYMMVAFAWWSVLLFTKNKDAFQAKEYIMRLAMDASEKPEDRNRLEQEYLQLRKNYRSQEKMIIGEASVFVLTLVIGVWLINRGYNKEMNAARERRNFLLSITHELKSPIASIRLILETFQIRELKREQVEKFSLNGLKEAERLNNLVDDLLLSAKLETAYQPNLEVFDLIVLLEETVQKLRSKHPSAKIHLESKAVEMPIMADRTGITSVLLNLIENALKYSLETPLIEVRISQNKEKISMDIADQGIGINDKEKKKIFQKFYRVGNEDTRKTKGTGLGLYIVKEIIKAHHGTIEVLDNQPKGTIFQIRLPNDQNH